MSDPSLVVTTPPPRAQSVWRHLRAALLILLLLILITGIAFPLAIGGLGVVVHRDTVNTTNNSTPSADVRPVGRPAPSPTPGPPWSTGLGIELSSHVRLAPFSPLTLVYTAALREPLMPTLMRPTVPRFPISSPAVAAGA